VHGSGSPGDPGDGAPAISEGFGVIDLPLPGDADLPAPAEAALPAPVEAGLPAPAGVGLPAPVPQAAPFRAEDADLPAPAEAGLPAPVAPHDAQYAEDNDLPMAADVGLPAPLDGGDTDLPMPADIGLPAPMEGDLPMPADIGLPAPLDADLGGDVGIISAVGDSDLPPAPGASDLPTPLESLPVPLDAALPMVNSQGADEAIAIDETDLPTSIAGEGGTPDAIGAPPQHSGGSGGMLSLEDMGIDLTDLDSDQPMDDLPPPPASDTDDGALWSDDGAEPPGLNDLAVPSDDYEGDLPKPPPAGTIDLTDLSGSDVPTSEVGAEFEIAEGDVRTSATAIAPTAQDPTDDAPLVKIKPKRSLRFRIAMAAILLLAIGGRLLTFTSLGPYGWFAISDALNRSEFEKALTTQRQAAQKQLDSDTAVAAQKALQNARTTQTQMPRFAPMASYAAYLAFMSSLRFGSESANEAAALQLLNSVGHTEKDDMQKLAIAARDAVKGKLARGRKASAQLAKRLPKDVDVAVLAAEIAMRAKTSKEALTLWKRATEVRESARTLFGLARAQLAAKQRSDAAKTARKVLKLSKDHAGARTLLAAILTDTKKGEKEALKLLEEVTDRKSLVGKAASMNELVTAYSYLGRIHLAHSRMSAAEAAFKAALKLDPQAAHALEGNGELLYQAGRYSEALARFEAALRVDADSLAAKLGTAKTYLAQEQRQKAKDLLAKLRAAGAKSPLVGYWQGRVEEALGQRDQAEAAYRWAISQGSDEDTSVVVAYVALAELLASQGKNQQAAEVLTEASAKLPKNAALHNAKGDVALQSGRLEEAKAEFKAALNLDDANLAAKFKLAVAHRRAREFTAAEKYFDEVAAADAEYPGLALERGSLFDQTGQNEKALAMYQDALKKAPEDIDLKLRVASAQVIAGHVTEETKKILREVQTKRRGSAEAHYFLGRALLVAKSNLPEAINYLKEATRIDRNRAEYYLYLGWAANDAGRLAVADEALTKALALDKNLGDIYWQRGVWLLKKGATKYAIEELEEAVKKRPSRYEAYATMALCYEDQPDYAGAEKAWRKAIEGNGEVADWHYRLGKILSQRGSHGETAEHLQKAVDLAEASLKPSSPTWLPDAYFRLAEAIRGSDPKKAIEYFNKFLDKTGVENAYRADALRALEALGTKRR